MIEPAGRERGGQFGRPGPRRCSQLHIHLTQGNPCGPSIYARVRLKRGALRRVWFISHGRHGRTVGPPSGASSEPDSRACTSTSKSSSKIVRIVLGLMTIGDCIPNVAASVVESEKTSLISEV
jgi:hypothetical protein